VLGVISIFFDATIKQFVSGVSGDGFSTRWQPQVTFHVRTVPLLLLLMFHLVFCCCFSCYTGDGFHQDCVVQEVLDHGWLFPWQFHIGDLHWHVGVKIKSVPPLQDRFRPGAVAKCGVVPHQRSSQSDWPSRRDDGVETG
jgi:hypothetical protein